jgi:hypothetical protein
VLVLLGVDLDNCSVGRKSALDMEVLVAVVVAVDAGPLGVGIPDDERDVLWVSVERRAVAAAATTVFEAQQTAQLDEEKLPVVRS